MFKPLALMAAISLSKLGAARADYVTSYQRVDFTFHQIDADSFSLRIQNAPGASGDWASAQYLAFLGFKGLGSLDGLTGSAVSSNVNGSTWSYQVGNLVGRGCNTKAQVEGLCMSVAPNVLLTDDLLLSFDRQGTQPAIAGLPHLKVGFTQDLSDNITGSLLSANLQLQARCDTNCEVTPADSTAELPEPGSIALASLALAAALAALAARRQLMRGG